MRKLDNIFLLLRKVTCVFIINNTHSSILFRLSKKKKIEAYKFANVNIYRKKCIVIE